jgi:L-fuculose-phosphate aldolase
VQQSEQELRALICRIGFLMYQKGYIDGTSGNISARLDSDRVLTTPSGLAKGFMQVEQLIIVDLDGKRVDTPTPANADLRPTSESDMHLECYRQRNDVNGVVHAHPPSAIALTLVGYDFQQCVIPELIMVLGLIATAPYATPSSSENRDAITELIKQHDAILLAHHGSLTVADSVWNAYLKLESLEHGATILHRAEQLGGVKSTIPPQQVEKLLDQREKLGLMRAGDRERFAIVLSGSSI